MMTERWVRIQSIFHAALARQTVGRTAFVRQACSQNISMQAEVGELLGYHEPRDELLEQTRLAISGLLDAADDAQDFRDQRIGHYQVVRVIGRGGMGTVYEAVQDHPRRTVALKVMRAGLTSPAALRRFRHESDILARLRHPGIAHVYEAGTVEGESGDTATLPSGIPYYAMEYVLQARTIVEHARNEDLSIRERLELFTLVCDAVQHAHDAGIVHRDLKPANILVDTAGRPKVIDFGVARIADSDLTLRTGADQIVGTLQYMSPEQCRGDGRQLDARSDVYALGVVLFQLLSGDLPYDLTGKAVGDAIRVIGEDDPQRLGSISRAFRGDLDTIVAKALARDKVRRYAAVSDFAADIRHYLRDEPIIARPASACYNFRKFAQRNRTLVGGVAAVILTCVCGVVVSTGLYLREQAARNESEFREYAANIAAAEAGLRSYDIGDARRRLEQAPQHLRGWEWQHFMRRTDRSRTTIVPSDESGPRATTRVAISPDGRRVAYGRVNGSVHVWDVASAGEVAHLRAFGTSVTALAFSPDGGLLAAGGADLTIKLWDGRTFAELPSLRGQPTHGPALDKVRWRFLHDLAFSPDSSMIAAGAWDGTLRLWDLASGQEVVRPEHAERVYGLAFSPDGARIATGSWDGIVKLWDVAGCRCISSNDLKAGQVYRLAFSPVGSEIIAGVEDGTLRLLDACTLQESRVFREYAAGALAVAFTPDGRCVVSASSDKTLRLWSVKDGAQRAVFLGHADGVMDVDVSPDGAWIASTSRDGTVKLWDTACEAVRTLRGHSAWVYGVAVSPDGTLIASCGGEHPRQDTIRVWDRFSGRLLHELPNRHTDLIWSLAFAPDGRRLVSGARDGMIRVWGVESGVLLNEWRGSDASITGVTFSPDGTRLVSGSEDGTIKWWNPDSRDLLFSRKHDGHVWCVAFSPDGGCLASGSSNRTVRIWNGATGEPLRTLREPSSVVRCVAFSPDAAYLAAGSEDGRWIVWNPRDWQLVAARQEHGADVRCLTFSPDSTRFVTASCDGSIKLWDMRRWQELAALRGHAQVLSVAFTPDGHDLVSGSTDRTIRIWEGAP